MSEEHVKQAERKRLVTGALNELFKQDFTYKEVMFWLSPAWKDWKEAHPRMRLPRVRIINPPTQGQYAEDAKRLGHRELLMKEALVDIPFSELSPRAQRLYLEAVKRNQGGDTTRLSDRTYTGRIRSEGETVSE